MSVKIATSFLVHDDLGYLAHAIGSASPVSEACLFLSRTPWYGQAGDWEPAAAIADQAGATVVLGDWASELEHRQAAYQHLLKQGYTHALIPDGDEIIEPRLQDTLVKIAENELADRVYVEWDTYWKSPEYVIRPRERFTPCILIDLRVAKPVGGRNFEGGRPLFLSAEHGIIHHLSYVGPDERIKRKISTWGHAKEVVPGWYENVWEAWDRNKQMHNLHPTHSQAYGFAERIHVPEILQPALARYRELTGSSATEDQIAVPQPWPKVSVVIPLHGGREDLLQCLSSLAVCKDLLHEVIVVDNASPDGAADLIDEDERFSFVSLLRNETNLGFAAACNRGADGATGEVVLYLNSDTVVPRAGLVRLIEALSRSGSIAAAGPYTNRAGHGQQIAPTYTSLDTLDLFAEDFANRRDEDAPDTDTDMLVGFCLAVRKSVLNEVGGFDERFGIGTFEDNDLCYRIRRAGYRMVLASRSFVHHHGSKTLGRLQEQRQTDIGALLATNEQLYRRKWQEDMESGFASHLSGLAPSAHARVTFDPSRRPDVRARKIKELARRADITLCMIVKDEERVLGDALASAKPFFSHMIVVDTGSTDRTVEIAEHAGAQVYHFPWTESFSEARNESLKYARETGCKWLFWMDADDTLPWSSGEAIVQAAINAPPEVAGFIVPVQFIEEGTEAGTSAAGTRVDHVKLFRNLPGLEFEGRIHEQILRSLHQAAGSNDRIARCEAVVLHSGYDTSVEGQKKKRIRDARLLELDLAERPDHPFVLFNLGMTDHYGGEHEGAVRWLRRCLEVSPTTDSHIRKAYALLAVSLRELELKDESLQALDEGLKVVPDDPELHFHAGLALTAIGRFEEAKTHYEQTLASNISGHFSSVDMGILGYKTYHNLGGLYLSLKQYREAREWLIKAVEAMPQFLPSVFTLFDAALEAQDLPTAQQMLQRIHDNEGPSESWVSMSSRYAEAVGGPGNAQAFLHRTIETNPNVAGPRLLLARKLLQSGCEDEAEPHLRILNEQGVPEAAYFLGICAIRVGDYPNALLWMERALSLNPDHEETREQVVNLRKALGQDNEDTTPAGITLEEAMAQLANDLGLNAEELLEYAEEDTVGGYSRDSDNSPNPRWPGGSVWEAEGKILYALVRALKPETIVEVGSLIGCSTSHLAAACRKNGMGRVYAVDPYAEFSRVDPELLEYIVPVKEDALQWTPPGKIDFLFEDGTHEPGFTMGIMEHLKPSFNHNAMVLCHDFHTKGVGEHVSREFVETLGKTGGALLIVPCNCGLGYIQID